jgi:hypothetical protein
MNNWRFGPLSSSRMHMEVLGVPIDLPERRRMFETPSCFSLNRYQTSSQVLPQLKNMAL